MVSTFQREWKKKPAIPVRNEPFTNAVLALTGPTVASEAEARRALQIIQRGRRRGAPTSLDGPPTFDTGDWDLARSWLLEWLPKIRAYRPTNRAVDESVREEINATLCAVGSGGLPMLIGIHG